MCVNGPAAVCSRRCCAPSSGSPAAGARRRSENRGKLPGLSAAPPRTHHGLRWSPAASCPAAAPRSMRPWRHISHWPSPIRSPRVSAAAGCARSTTRPARPPTPSNSFPVLRPPADPSACPARYGVSPRSTRATGVSIGGFFSNPRNASRARGTRSLARWRARWRRPRLRSWRTESCVPSSAATRAWSKRARCWSRSSSPPSSVRSSCAARGPSTRARPPAS